MSDEFLGQLTYHTRALRLVAGVLALFGIIPGMPTIAFFLLAAVLGGYLIEHIPVFSPPAIYFLFSGMLEEIGLLWSRRIEFICKISLFL